jgi:hypothetical protein
MTDDSKRLPWTFQWKQVGGFFQRFTSLGCFCFAILALPKMYLSLLYLSWHFRILAVPDIEVLQAVKIFFPIRRKDQFIAATVLRAFYVELSFHSYRRSVGKRGRRPFLNAPTSPWIKGCILFPNPRPPYDRYENTGSSKSAQKLAGVATPRQCDGSTEWPLR